MADKYLEDLKDTIFTYYDNNGAKQKEFNEHYVKLMNDDSTVGTFDFDNTGNPNDKNGKYWEISYHYEGENMGTRVVDDEFAKHNKKVLGNSDREAYVMPSLKYTVNKDFNEQFKDIYSRPKPTQPVTMTTSAPKTTSRKTTKQTEPEVVQEPIQEQPTTEETEA